MHNCTNSLVAVVGIGLREGAIGGFDIYPNPTTDRFAIYTKDLPTETFSISIQYSRD